MVKLEESKYKWINKIRYSVLRLKYLSVTLEINEIKKIAVWSQSYFYLIVVIKASLFVFFLAADYFLNFK